MIYKTYLWISKSASEGFLGSRLVEYPFVIKNLKKIPNAGKVLLVGCAGDPLSTIIPALGYETYGLDIKYVAVRYPSFQFIQGDIRRTDFPDNYFDAIVAVSTIEHIGIVEGDYAGDRKAVKEMMRILKPKGIMLLTVPLAPQARIEMWERKYDLKSLDNLLNDWIISRRELYKNDKGYWVLCSSKDTPIDGIICLRAGKQAKLSCGKDDT